MKHYIHIIILFACSFANAQSLSIIPQSGDTTYRVEIMITKNSGEEVTRLLPEMDSTAAAKVVADLLNSFYDDEARAFHNFEDSRSTANLIGNIYRDFTGVNIAQSGNEALEAEFAGRWRLREGANNDIINLNQNGAFSLNNKTGRIRIFSKLKIRLVNYLDENVFLYSKDGRVYRGKDSANQNIVLIKIR